MATGDQQILSIDSVTSLSNQFRAAAEHCQLISSTLSSQTSGLVWESRAAEAFMQDISSCVRLSEELARLCNNLAYKIDNSIFLLGWSMNT